MMMMTNSNYRLQTMMRTAVTLVIHAFYLFESNYLEFNLTSVIEDKFLSLWICFCKS